MPPASTPEAAEAPAERPRLRAKPKLNIAADTAGDSPEAAPAAERPLQPAPEPAGPEAAATPVKLRLQTPQPAAPEPPLPPLPPPAAGLLPPMPPPVVAPPEPPAEEIPLPPPPPPALPVDETPLPDALPPPVPPGNEDDELRPPDHILPHLTASRPIAEIEKQVRKPVSAASLRKKKSPLKAVLIIGAVLLVVGTGFWLAGTVVYQKFFEEKSVEIARLPGQIVDKAHAVVEDRRALENARIEALGEGREPPPARAIGPAPIVTPEPAPTAVADAAVTAYAPGEDIVPELQAPPEAPQPGPEFIGFVEGARIGGVFQGSPARALINGRTVRAGETVDERLGVVFVGLDDSRLRLIFRDASGAELIRKF